MSKFLFGFIIVYNILIKINVLNGQTCKVAPDNTDFGDANSLRDYLVMNTDIVCYDLNLLSSETDPCSNAVHNVELVAMNCGMN